MATDDRTDPNRKYLAGLAESWPAQWERLPLLQEHFWFGVHEHVPGPSTYITLLRDPVDRAISAYHYHAARGQIRRPLEEYLVGEDVGRDNGQTRRLAGPPAHPNDPVCTDETLARALSHLDAHVAVAGLNERFDESLVLLSRHFGWRPLYYVRHGASTGRAPASALSDEVLTEVRRRNRYDLELHRIATERFDHRIAAEPGFSDAVARFREGNERYGRTATARRAARAPVRALRAAARRVVPGRGR